MFVPVCHEDGSYAEVQCHYSTGYCWCVNEDGKPIPRTSTRYDRPNCKKEKRKRNRRGKGKKRKNRRKKTRRTSNGETDLNSSSKRQCAQNDRKEFNQNILNSLTEEFGKHHSRSLEPEGLIGDQKKKIIEWKFDQMDANRDNDLRKREFKTFRLAIKRLAKNKFCARNFWKYCDLDDDKRVTRSEWATCLGVDINISFRIFMSLSSEEDKTKQKGRKRNNSEDQEPKDSEGQGSAIEDWALGGALTKSSVNAPASLIAEVEERINCWVEHRAAIEGSKGGDLASYIPECQPDGRFQSVQCYKTSGYCWCVEELTGRPIPGTSRQNQTPTCAPGSISQSSRVTQNEWVKCPENRKRQFREHLMDYMTKQMVESSKDQDMSYLFSEKAAELSLEERVGKWQFLDLDKNRDGMLSRREIRPFRRVLKEDRKLRLCGKRIQNHCDPDSDENITFTEWELCIGLRGETVQIPLPRIDPANRRGPNPLKMWLKAD
ncbi:SPARC-related modular calcium-binding protein 2-like isoform X2 [Tigriopus californicus]|nr:SPARC-related modular calcium-binding protein 2-like isoform X2 [Tigriopus californicus]